MKTHCSFADPLSELVMSAIPGAPGLNRPLNARQTACFANSWRFRAPSRNSPGPRTGTAPRGPDTRCLYVCTHFPLWVITMRAGYRPRAALCGWPDANEGGCDSRSPCSSLHLAGPLLILSSPFKHRTVCRTIPPATPAPTLVYSE